MLIWDDLWYWGFFTQRSIKTTNGEVNSGYARQFGWNKDKFWAQFSSQKKDEQKIKVLAERFLDLWGFETTN